MHMRFEVQGPSRKNTVRLFSIALLALAASSWSAGATERFSIEQLMSVPGYTGASFSPDGKTLLVSTTRSGVGNLYTVPVIGGVPQQLTHSTTETIDEIGYFPFDDRILYSSDQGETNSIISSPAITMVRFTILHPAPN